MPSAQQTLRNRLSIIQKVFSIEKIVTIKPTLSSIAGYYRINRLAYSLFYKGNDFIHMGITRTGRYKKDDLLAQARIVERYIQETKAKKVLELATGRGANSAYLARKYPHVVFYGLDLPNGHLSYALNKAKTLKNFHLVEGDYHNLKEFPANSFEVIFVVEALCHSMQKEKVIQEAKRVLKKNGIFIIIDGYGNQAALTSPESKIAMKLVALGMMVEEFEDYEKVKKTVIKQGFSIISEEDASQLVLPSARRMEKLAEAFFSFPSFIARFIIKFLPPEFSHNAISGYLMPVLVTLKVARYQILIAKK